MLRFLAGLAVMHVAGWSHHTTASEFDTSKLILLRGTVRKVEWINPHAWLHLEVKDPEGKITVWRIEGASPGIYRERQFPTESLTEGTEISITGYPARSGESMADGGTITFLDGKRIFFGGSAPIDGLDPEGRPCIRKSRNPACK